MNLSSMFCIGKFVVYVSFAVVVIPLYLNYICIGIDIFVHHITVPGLICLCKYLCLLKYVGVLYKIYSLVAIRIGNFINAYFLYIICYTIFSILVDLHSQ